MNKSRPFLLLVVTLCLLLLILLIFWLAQLPVRLSAQLATQLETTSNLKLETSHAKLHFADGLSLQLEDVAVQSMETKDYVATADRMYIGLSPLAVFGSALTLHDVRLEKPVFNIDVARANPLSLFGVSHLQLRDGRLKLHDSALKSVVTLSDVNGTIARDAAGSVLRLQYIVNTKIVAVSINVEDVDRLFNSGTPADINIASKATQVTFSGRMKWLDALTLDGQGMIDSASHRDLADILGIPVAAQSATTPFRAGGGLSTTGLSAQFKTLALEVGANSFSGNGAIFAAPERVELAADLNTDTLSLLQPIRVLDAPWSEEPLGLSALTAANQTLKVAVGDLQLRGVSLGPTTLNARVENGAANIDLQCTPKDGGQLNVKLDHRATGLRFNVLAKQFDASQLIGGVLGFPGVSGAIDLAAEGTTQATSLAQLVSNLAGTLKINATALKAPGIDIIQVLSKAGSGWKASDASAKPFEFKLQGDLRDGVIAISEGQVGLLQTKGDIDLLRQDFDVQLPDGLGLNGPWMKPTVSPRKAKPKAN